MPLRSHIAVLLTGCLLVALSVASGAEIAPKKAAPVGKAVPPEIKFLEYLGTLEDDDGNWTEIDIQLIATTALPAPEGKAKTSAKAEATAKPAAERK